MHESTPMILALEMSQCQPLSLSHRFQPKEGANGSRAPSRMDGVRNKDLIPKRTPGKITYRVKLKRRRLSKTTWKYLKLPS